jgi:hypothetical protein
MNLLNLFWDHVITSNIKCSIGIKSGARLFSKKHTDIIKLCNRIRRQNKRLQNNSWNER